jgi:hypothetical protein
MLPQSSIEHSPLIKGAARSARGLSVWPLETIKTTPGRLRDRCRFAFFPFC